MRDETGLKSDLFNRLAPGFSADGFKLVAPNDRFEKKSGDVTAIFQLVCLDGKPGYRIQPNVGVRIERVEKIFHQTSGFESKFQKDTATMGNSIGMFLQGDSRACEFLLRSGSEAAPVADGVARAFREFELPYYARWGLLAAIDEELNNRPTERSVHRPMLWFRCSTGIIVAKLRVRPDYTQLAALYTKAMAADNNGFYLKRFQGLLQSLESIEPEGDSASS
jgi:hypothetical protein